MNKTIALIRHAKSSWADLRLPDFDRPLNERGKRDAPMMGERLQKAGMIPDLILSSTAVRAASTAKAIAKAMNISTKKIVWKEEMYHCGADIFEQVIAKQNDATNFLFLVAHNPGITYFANALSADFAIDNVPTCGIVIARAAVATWPEFLEAEKKIIHFDYPKNYNP